MQISIHAKTGVQWHKRYAEFFRKGFAAHGIDARVTAAGTRDTDDDVAVVFGPNYFKGVERSGLPYLMVKVIISPATTLAWLALFSNHKSTVSTLTSFDGIQSA